MKHSNEFESEQLKSWKAEQHRIASQVVLRDDDHSDWISRKPVHVQKSNDCPDTQTSAAIGDARFKRLPRVGTKRALYGGVDVSFPDNDERSAQSVATYVVLEATTTISTTATSPMTTTTTFKVVYQDFLYFDLTIPYVSSFLSFREIESLEFLVRKQLRDSTHVTPSVIMVDGNGILHARRAGIACFLGVRTGIPTIGIGKTLYCEDGLEKEQVRNGIDRTLAALQDLCAKSSLTIPMDRQSSSILVDRVTCRPDDIGHQPLVDRDMILQQLAPVCTGIAVKLEGVSGQVLCAALLGHGGSIGVKRKEKRGTKNPIYVSVGHDISLDEAIALCCELSQARIPEPVRQADLWGRELLRQKKKKHEA
jgi:endonuclease V